MELLDTWVMWNLVLVCLETVLVLVQDRSMLCAKHTISSEIILDAPDGNPTLCGSSGSSFNPFRDSGDLDAR
jgi:hypothetical protein